MFPLHFKTVFYLHSVWYQAYTKNTEHAYACLQDEISHVYLGSREPQVVFEEAPESPLEDDTV